MTDKSGEIRGGGAASHDESEPGPLGAQAQASSVADLPLDAASPGEQGRPVFPQDVDELAANGPARDTSETQQMGGSTGHGGGGAGSASIDSGGSGGPGSQRGSGH